VILDEVRRKRADELLSDDATSLAEVAFALGFSEHSAFTRAYKSWSGTAPMAHRHPPGAPKRR